MNNFTTAYEASQRRIFKFSKYEHCKDNNPQLLALNWEQIKELISERLIRENKVGPAISGAYFSREVWRKEGDTVKEAVSLRNTTELAMRAPLRGNVFVEGLSLLILEFDGRAKRNEILTTLTRLGYAAIVYSTYTHLANGVEKYRVVIPLAQDISKKDYYDLWFRVSGFFKFKNDPATKDAARMQDLPSCPQSRKNLAVCFEVQGAFLDASTVPQVDEEMEVPELFRKSSPKKREDVIDIDDEDFIRITSESWVNKAVDRTLEKMRKAVDGEKHFTLLCCAYNLGGFLYTKFFTEEQVSGWLFDALEGRAEDEEKAWETIERGLAAGAEEPWEMPKDEIDPNVEFYEPFKNMEDEKNMKTEMQLTTNQSNPTPFVEVQSPSVEDTKTYVSSEKSLSNRGFERVEALQNRRRGAFDPFVEGDLKNAKQDENSKFENEPLSLTSQLRRVQPLTREMLPMALRDWIFDAAEQTSCPVDFIAIPAIIGLGSLLSDITIKPKKFADWKVVPNLWGFIVGAPGSRKSAAVREGNFAIEKLQKEAAEIYKEELKEFEPVRKVHEAKELALKTALAKVAKEFVEGTGVENEFKRAFDNSNLDELEPPILKQYVADDPTVEAAGLIFQNNPRGFLLDYDELARFFATLNKSGREGDRQVWLTAWNGNAPLKFTNRIGRGVVIIPNSCVSIFGTIQPDVIAKIVKNSSGENRDGLIPRFQLAVHPDKVDYKQIDRLPNYEAKKRAFDVFKFCDTMTAENLGVVKDFEDQEVDVRFSADAQKLFDEWLYAIEHRKSNGRETTIMKEHLDKYNSLMPSLALIFHCCDVADGAPSSSVGYEATLMAIQWCDYLESHARRIYDQASDSDTTLLERLAEKIILLPNPFKLSDLTRKKWAGLSNQREVEDLLLDLEEKNWLYCETVRTAGRSAKTYYVNSTLFENSDSIPTTPSQKGEKPQKGATYPNSNMRSGQTGTSHKFFAPPQMGEQSSQKSLQPAYYDSAARAKVRAERAKAMEEAHTIEQVEDTPTPPAFSTTDADFDSLDI